MTTELARDPGVPRTLAAAAVAEADLQALADQLRGTLIRPGEGAYEEARLVWNGMVDKRPGAIVRCGAADDVIAAVDFARRHGLIVSVRGGGHNAAGNAVCDGGLVIDLSEMRAVSVDPAAGTVRAEGGVTIGDLDSETQAFGLAVPMGVVTATGIAGLTLGGGLGWLRRRYGLSCDNIVSAEVVTADGRLVTASAQENPDLLWALKGGGGNFGVVTEFEFRAYPVGPEVFFAFVIHAGGDAVGALRFYDEWAANAPDDISSFSILWHAPEIEEIPAEHHGKPIVVFLAMHSGAPEAGAAALQALRNFGRPIADLSGVTPYVEVQQFFDADYPAHEMRYYWKSRYIGRLTGDAIRILVDLNESSPSHHSTVDIWQLGGAVARVAATESAYGDRSAPFLIGIESNWEDAADDAECVAWGRRAYEALAPFATGGEYLNFPGLYEDSESMVRETFGANYDRLVEIKRRYDPGNLFRLNQNIPV